MLKSFEEETQPLTEHEERDLLPLFIAGLKTKIGKHNSVTNKEIITRLKMAGIKVDAPRVRKIINHIRVHDLVEGLIATSDGYYIATSEKELKDYEESLKGREDAIRAVRLSIIRQRQHIYYPVQKTLFD